MTNVEVSEKALKLFNEDKIDEWVNTVAFSIIVFERIPNKCVKKGSVEVLLGVLLK